MLTQQKLEENYRKKDNWFLNQFKTFLIENGINDELLANVLAIVGEHRRIPIGALVASLTRFGEPQEIADKIAIYRNQGWLTIKQGMCSPVYLPDQEELEEFEHRLVPFPLIEEPKEVKTPWEYGYHTIKGSLILRENPPKWMPLDHVNLVNKIPLEIDLEAMNQTQLKWEGLDKPLKGETQYAFVKRQERFGFFCENMISFAKQQEHKPIWFAHRYDKRGRTYPTGYHFNYQGNDYQKNCLELFNKEVIK